MTRVRDPLLPALLPFIHTHSVFTLEEFRAHFRTLGRDSTSAGYALDYLHREGRLVIARRGLYTRDEWIDPWLLASKLAEDVVLSHESALAFHGFLELQHHLPFLTAARMKPFDYRQVVYRPYRVHPDRLQRTSTIEVEREEQPLRIATLEAALVDCLAEFGLGPQDLDTLIGVFRRTRAASDPDAMVEHALRSKSPLLVSRLGFALTCTRWDDVSSWARMMLEKHMLPRPDYFRRTERTDEDRLLPRWNLILTPEQWKHWRR